MKMNPTKYRAEYLTKLGNVVRQLRIDKGMSQDDLAQACGYKSRSSINKIEKGVYNLPLPKIEVLAEVLGVTPMYFLGIEVLPKEDIHFNADEVSLIESYRRLNEKGKEKAIEYIVDLTDNKKYAEKGISGHGLG